MVHLNMKHNRNQAKKDDSKKKAKHIALNMYHTLFFWPLFVLGGRVVARVVMNLWDLIEPGM